MDPNKDFIHIDDVFKNLRNGEEREGSGAWLNMKTLLDAEMPVGGVVSGGRSVRRYIIPVLALLLLGGGATYWKLSNNNDQPATVAAVEPTRSGAQNGAGMQPSGKGNNDNSHAITTAAVTQNEHTNDNHHTANKTTGKEPVTAKVPATATGSRNAAATASNTSTHNKNRPATRNTTHKDNPADLTPAKTTKDLTPQPSALAQNDKPAAQPDQHTAQGNTTPKADVATAQRTATVVKPEILKHQQVVETIAPKETAPAALAAANNTNGNGKGQQAKHTAAKTTPANTWKTAAIVNNKKIVQSPDGNFYKEERDTFKRIDLVERYTYPKGNAGRNTLPKVVTDTVAITRIENIRYVPLTKLDLIELKKLNVNIVVKELVPLAKLRARTVASEHINLVPLSNYKVASRRVDPSTFNKLIQNTAGGLAGYFDGSRNFYAAIMAGGNASFGNPGAFGMQIGIAGLLSLSERWTISAELKYMNHYFNNYNLKDESVSYDVSKTQNGSGWLFSGNALVNSSVYKINSYGSIQMPVLLSYNLGRVSIFGGVNLAYAFPIDWEKRTNVNTLFVESQQQQDKNPYQNTSFLFDEKNDFASRFGLGYALGLNYDLSRKVSLDARVSQILVDNAKSNLESVNKLFRLPSLQLSFGYYFGRKDRVVYIMDKR